MTTARCKTCIYSGYAAGCLACLYILHTRRCRPCPAGDRCFVRETERNIIMKKREWDVVRAKQLYDEGLDDLSIADMVGATEGAIRAWRARNRLKTNTATVRGKRTETPTPDPAPGLTGPNWKPIALCHPAPDKPMPETAQTVPPPEAPFVPATPVTNEPPVPPEDPPAPTAAAPVPTPPASPRMELSLFTGSCRIYITGNAAEVIPLLDSARSLAVGLLPK